MLEFRILGPVEAHGPAGPVRLGGPRQQAVLAALLLGGNRVVSLDAIVDAIWGEAPPRTARRQVQNQVSALRLALTGTGHGVADTPIATRAAGYLLWLETEQLDALAFEREAEQARRLWSDGRIADTASCARAALRRWRGPALSGVAGPGAADQAARLEELRLDLLTLRIEADLALGRHQQLVGELTVLTRGHPLRERLRAQLMTALYRSGRKTDALTAYDTARNLLVEQYGLDPGPDLTALRQAILTDAPALGPVSGAGAVGPADDDPEADHAGPAGPAGPLRVGKPVQLAAGPAALLGRDQELAELAGALAAGGACVVAGRTGAGTSSLALRACRDAADRYPDGQLHLHLRNACGTPVDPADALDDALVALGVSRADLPEHLDARSGLYRTLLADRRVLVLLDDAVDADQVRPLLPGSTTSTVVIAGGPSLIAVEGARLVTAGPLPAEAALALLLPDHPAAPVITTPTVPPVNGAAGARSEACRVAGARLDAARAVVEACEGLAGLVRAAGTWLVRFGVAGGGLGVEQLAGLLADERQRLGVLALADPRVRQRLRRRYDGLGAAARQAFPALGEVTAVDAARAARLWGMDRFAALEVLAQLADAELVEVAGGPVGVPRYRVGALARCLARELAGHQPTGRDRARMPLVEVVGQ